MFRNTLKQMKLIVTIELKFDQLTKTEKQDDIWEYNDL